MEKTLLKAIIFDNEGIMADSSWNYVSKLAYPLHHRRLSGDDFKRSLQIPCYDDFGKKSNLFERYTTGKISGKEFFYGVLGSYGAKKNPNNEMMLRNAFRGLITRTNEEAVDFIRQLKKKKNLKILMLSNTSPDIIQGHKSRDGYYYDLFDKCYFSYDIGFRKPKIQAYQYLLSDQNLKSEECLYVDDMERNLEPAKRMGMQTLNHKIGQGELLDKLRYLLK